MSRRAVPSALLALARPAARLAAAALLAAPLVLGAPGAARAQEVLDARTLDGARTPPLTGASIEGAFSLERNPGGLGSYDGTELRYTYVQPGDGNRAHGVYLATRLFDSLAFGFGASPVLLAGKTGPDYTKWSLGFGVPLGDASGFGVAWHHFTSSDSDDYDGADALDLGVHLEPARLLALSFAAQNLNRPAFRAASETDPVAAPGAIVGRSYTFSAGLRPLGEVLTLGADLRWQPGAQGTTRRWTPTYFAQLAAIDGLSVEASFDVDDRVFLTMTLDWEHTGLTGGLPFGPDLTGSPFLVSVRASDERHEPLTAPRRRAVELDWTRPFGYNPAAQFFGEPPADFLSELLLLQRIARDEAIGAVVVRIESLDVGWARAAELRAGLEAVRAAGKEVQVHLGGGGDKEYYVASAADRVVGHPAANYEINGLTLDAVFLNRTLSKVGVEPQFVRVGDYKTAPNLFTESEATPSEREMNGWLASDLNETQLRAIRGSRPLDAAALEVAMARGVLTAEDARKAGLLDGTASWSELLSDVRKEWGMAEEYRDARDAETRWGPAPRIAVVYLDGEITGERESDARARERGPMAGLLGPSGDAAFLRGLDAAMNDSSVRAIVLRIDSPGGSVVASDDIWSAVMAARVRKPIIASLGDVAASGGYYVAAGADTIFAEENTVTGSIGIFGGKFSFAGLFEMLGIGTETNRTAPRADLFAMDRPWTTDELAEMQRVIDDGYQRFLGAIVAGRKMEREKIDAVGRGRVWTGRQALERGLVDRVGGLVEAVAEAAQRARIRPGTPLEVVALPERGLLSGLDAELSGPALPATLATRLRPLVQAAADMPKDRVRARLPYDLVIK